MGHSRHIIKISFLLVASVIMIGCDVIGVACTDILLPNVQVEVRDSAGRGAALGATGEARHQGGDVSVLSAFDTLHLSERSHRENAGRYTITVWKPGHKTATVTAEVAEDQCHVKTETVRVTLLRDHAAVEMIPLLFLKGNRVEGENSSAGVRLLGDTLQILGSAFTFCAELEAVAYRTGDQVHVQLRPSALPPNCAGRLRLQNYELRYRLSPGRHYLMVTAPMDDRPTLYIGTMTVGS